MKALSLQRLELVDFTQTTLAMKNQQKQRVQHVRAPKTEPRMELSWITHIVCGVFTATVTEVTLNKQAQSKHTLHWIS